MRFLAPHWLLLVPFLAAVAWQWPGLRLTRPLRALVLLVLVLLLAGPEIRRQSEGLDLWLLVDRSESADETLLPRLGEWEEILAAGRSADDRLFAVDFADSAVTRGAVLRAGAGGTEFAGRRGATRLASAARHALAQASPDRSARLLALTDGHPTESLDGLAEELRARGIALDLRLAPDSDADDFAVASIAAPRRVGPREALVVEATVRGSTDGVVPVELVRDGEPIGSGEATIVDGEARVRFADRPARPGAHRYVLRVKGGLDAHPGNDEAARWVEVTGGPRLLLVSGYDPIPLGAALRAEGLAVEETTDLAALHVGMLSGARGVILDNVPAHRIPVDFVRALEFYVTAQGGGLAMIGGRYSFAGGGWAGSPVAPLLPVTMELKDEHRKLAVAMALVMDRSGSMAMTAPGSTVTKMSLAAEGAGRSIELLGEKDLAVVIPVDSAAHPLSDGLMAVGPNRAKLASAARRVTSAGGGIFCYTGLASAWKMLRDAPVGQRHVILFADAADAEEPGDYVALLAEMTAQKCTVSVIGLGTERDPDADFLRDVANRGGGRIFFSDRPTDLPALFQMETATIARSAFIEEPAAVKGTPGWFEIGAAPLEWPAAVDGYNLVYLRPGASQAAVSGDDFGAPLVAFWPRGAGRTASVAFPLGGERSEQARAWQGYGALAGTLARWLVGPGTPEGLGLRTTVEGSSLRAELFFDESWTGRVAAAAPRLVVSRGDEGAAETVTWERESPGHFVARDDVAGGEALRLAVVVGDTALAAGPIDVGVDPEWSFDRRRRDELRAVSRSSGGEERVDLAEVWKAPRVRAWRGLSRPLLGLLLALLLAEAFQTQTGWRPRARRGASPAAAPLRAPPGGSGGGS
ncbi:MAG: hypothetical protein ACKO3G_05500 [Planctomycetaceae bacterium]